MKEILSEDEENRRKKFNEILKAQEKKGGLIVGKVEVGNGVFVDKSLKYDLLDLEEESTNLSSDLSVSTTEIEEKNVKLEENEGEISIKSFGGISRGSSNFRGRGRFQSGNNSKEEFGDGKGRGRGRGAFRASSGNFVRGRKQFEKKS